MTIQNFSGGGDDTLFIVVMHVVVVVARTLRLHWFIGIHASYYASLSEAAFCCVW